MSFRYSNKLSIFLHGFISSACWVPTPIHFISLKTQKQETQEKNVNQQETMEQAYNKYITLQIYRNATLDEYTPSELYDMVQSLFNYAIAVVKTHFEENVQAFLYVNKDFYELFDFREIKRTFIETLETPDQLSTNDLKEQIVQEVFRTYIGLLETNAGMGLGTTIQIDLWKKIHED